MDSAIQLLNNWGLVFHWWLRNRMNYLRRLPLQIWKRPSPANPHCKKPTSQKRKEKLWKKGSPFPHRGWVDGELIRNATYRSYETKKYFKTSCAPYRIAWTACCKLEDAVVSHVKNTHPELQTLPQNWRAPSLGFCTWTHRWGISAGSWSHITFLSGHHHWISIRTYSAQFLSGFRFYDLYLVLIVQWQVS